MGTTEPRTPGRLQAVAQRIAPLALIALLAAVAPARPTPRFPAGAGTPDEDAAAFAAELDALHATMDDGRWGAARRRLAALLDDPRLRPQVRARRDEVELDLLRVAFFESHDPPDAADVVAGELVVHNPTNGHVKVRYRDRQALEADTERVGLPSGERCRLHPLEFTGAHAVELRGPDGAGFPPVWIGAGGGEAWCARVETHPGIAGDPRVHVTARIDHIAGTAVRPVAAVDDLGVAARPRATLRVQVGGGHLSLRYNGRTVLRADVPRDLAGRAGLGDDGRETEDRIGWDEVTLEGRGGTVWIGGQRDRAVREQWSAFRAALGDRRLLPAWAYARPGDAPAPLDASAEAALRERQRPRLAAARRRAVAGELDAALADLAALAARHPGFAAPWETQAELLLLDGRGAPAEALLARAETAGVRSERLATLRATLVKARRGPDWLSWQRRVTAHYDVRTDLDAHLAEDAALALENAYRFFCDDLGVEPDDGPRLRAYVFSGRQGFTDYTGDVLGTRFHSAAGVYTPVLRQLLAWNLPDRAQLLATLRHEGFHQFARLHLGDLPLWLNEGLAEDYEASKAPGGRWRPGSLSVDHLAVLARPDALEPLAAFLDLDAEAFYARPAAHYAQAWALVHLLRHGEPEHAELFAGLLAAARDGPPGGDAVRACLVDHGLERLDARLAAHVARLIGRKPEPAPGR